MSSSFQQPSPQDGPCLRFPEHIGLHPQMTYETAVGMLLRAHQLAQNTPFAWGYVDKPQDGQVMLLYLPPQSPFPNDGVRYQDAEVKYTIPAGSREIEVSEIKNGFIPGSGETAASRVRRRFRFMKGGDPRLVLVHYSRGQPTPILPTLINTPVRAYPLRPVSEPAVYVIGEKAGHKVYPPAHPMAGGAPGGQPMPPPSIGLGMNLSQQQAMLAQQNNNMDALERRRRERAASTSAPRPPVMEPEGSDDETELISTRTLALARYRRNHDLMNEVFTQAAFGSKNAPPAPSPYSIFAQGDLDDKVTKLQAEVEELKAKSALRRSRFDDASGDTLMASLAESIKT
ncbi:hypothetical protein BDQ17DRAFT_1343234 [Cyathus striatus]|nr:hypothetical protein BDQ17DRAFT_1343234 [Cyathus striatus]